MAKQRKEQPRDSKGKFVKVGGSHGVWVAEIPTDTSKKYTDKELKPGIGTIYRGTGK